MMLDTIKYRFGVGHGHDVTKFRRSCVNFDLFDFLLFLYFVTLHADQLSINVGDYHLRINNLIAFSLVLIFALKFRQELFEIDRRLVFAFALLTSSIVLSLLFSSYKGRALLYLGWYLFTVVGYFLLPYFLIKNGDENKFLKLYFASFLLVGAYALLQFTFSLLGYADPFANQRIIGSLVRPNAFAYEPSYYALYMTPFVMLCNFQYLTAPSQPFFIFRRWRLGHIIFINALFLISTSTSTLFAYAIFFLLLLFSPFRRHFVKAIVLFSLFLFLGLVSFPYMMKSFYLKFFFNGFMTHHSFFERWAGIEYAWKVFLDHPIFGVGLGGFPSYFMDSWSIGILDASWIYPEGISYFFSNPAKCFEAMNVTTEVLASVGTLGLLCVAFLLVVFYQMFKKASLVDSQKAYGYFLSFVVMIIVLQFNQGLLRTYAWVYCGSIFALMEKVLSKGCTTPSLKIFPNGDTDNKADQVYPEIPQADFEEGVIARKIES